MSWKDALLGLAGIISPTFVAETKKLGKYEDDPGEWTFKYKDWRCPQSTVSECKALWAEWCKEEHGADAKPSFPSGSYLHGKWDDAGTFEAAADGSYFLVHSSKCVKPLQPADKAKLVSLKNENERKLTAQNKKEAQEFLKEIGADQIGVKMDWVSFPHYYGSFSKEALGNHTRDDYFRYTWNRLKEKAYCPRLFSVPTSEKPSGDCQFLCWYKGQNGKAERLFWQECGRAHDRSEVVLPTRW